MSGFTRIQVALAMEETGLVPLFYHHDKEISKEVIPHAMPEAQGSSSSPTGATSPTRFLPG